MFYTCLPVHQGGGGLCFGEGEALPTHPQNYGMGGTHTTGMHSYLSIGCCTRTECKGEVLVLLYSVYISLEF